MGCWCVSLLARGRPTPPRRTPVFLHAPEGSMSRLGRLALSSLFAAALLITDSLAQTVRLNGPLARPVGGDVREFQINRNGNRVFYVADQERDDVFELYGVKPGAPPYRLNVTLPVISDVSQFQLSPDGQRVLYLAN